MRVRRGGGSRSGLPEATWEGIGLAMSPAQQGLVYAAVEVPNQKKRHLQVGMEGSRGKSGRRWKAFLMYFGRSSPIPKIR